MTDVGISRDPNARRATLDWEPWATGRNNIMITVPSIIHYGQSPFLGMVEGVLDYAT